MPTEEVSFEGEIRDWGVKYLRRHYKQFAAMFDREELEHEARYVFCRVWSVHPEVRYSYEDFFRLYKVGVRFRVKKHAKACFPSSHYGICKSLTREDGTLTDFPVPHEVQGVIELMSHLPAELKEVGMLLAREVLGVQTIPTIHRRRLTGPRRLRGKRIASETLSEALSRHFNLEGRDLLKELETALVGEVAQTGRSAVKSKR